MAHQTRLDGLNVGAIKRHVVAPSYSALGTRLSSDFNTPLHHVENLYVSMSSPRRVLDTKLTRDSTGASGYIGGQVLHDLVAARLHVRVRALVRSEQSAKAISAAFPSVETVSGDLDNAAVITEEVKQADIVLRTRPLMFPA